MFDQQNWPGGPGVRSAFMMTIADMVVATEKPTSEVSLLVQSIVSAKSGMAAAFRAANAATAGTARGGADHRVFDAALKAAMSSVDGSTIPLSYDRMSEAIASVPDLAIRTAAGQAANDLFARIPTGLGGAPDKRLLGRMRAAAVRAAKARLERDDAVQAVLEAAESARDIADRTALATSKIVALGVSVHAATAAVFEAAIRDVPPHSLQSAVGKACERLQDMASRHGDLVAGFVAALTMMIHDDASSRRKYQTAARGAEKLCRDEAVAQTVNMMTESTFEEIYTALVSAAYATSDGSAFESGYERALADAFGVDQRQIQLYKARGAAPDPEDGITGAALLELQQRLSESLEWLLGSEDDMSRLERFRAALNADYKASASDESMHGIISLYEMAYRAGYEKAREIADKKSGSPRRRR